jgi:hypothetical protein
MTRAAIICKLHEIIDHHLFGPGGWPAEREAVPAIFRYVRELGLYENVPDSPGTARQTLLGEELKLYLMMAFAGAWHLWDIPYLLEEHGYLDEGNADELCMLQPIEAAERKLRQCVFRAYFEFCHRSSVSH